MDELTKQRIKSLVEQCYEPPQRRWLLPIAVCLSLAIGLAVGWRFLPYSDEPEQVQQSAR